MKKKKTVKKTVKGKTTRRTHEQVKPLTYQANPLTYEQALEEAKVGRLLHDESEADDDGFIDGAGFDRYGGFPGDGLS